MTELSTDILGWAETMTEYVARNMALQADAPRRLRTGLAPFDPEDAAYTSAVVQALCLQITDRLTELDSAAPPAEGEPSQAAAVVAAVLIHAVLAGAGLATRLADGDITAPGALGAYLTAFAETCDTPGR